MVAVPEDTDAPDGDRNTNVAAEGVTRAPAMRASKRDTCAAPRSYTSGARTRNAAPTSLGMGTDQLSAMV
jgi:hypothetical protein